MLKKKLAEYNKRVKEQEKKANALQESLKQSEGLKPELKREHSSSSVSSSFSRTHILSVASIFLSLAGLYYERKELIELVNRSQPNPEP